MDQNYSIKEILSAVNEIKEEKKRAIPNIVESKTRKIDNSDIPKNTLKLIEEAEKKNI